MQTKPTHTKTPCTCRISRSECNSAFVYDDTGKTVAEIPMEQTPYLKAEFTTLCAGAALQKLNRELRVK